MQNSETKIACACGCLAEPNRLKICGCLKNGERCVCEIFDELDLPQNLVSHHLRKLRDCGFVRVRVDGRRKFYSLAPENFADVADFLNSLSQNV